MGGEVLNISPIVVWVVALSQLLTFFLTVYGLLSSGSRANGKRLDDHGVRLDALDRRLQHVEAQVTALPSRDDMHRLQLAVERMNGRLDVMSAQMGGQREIMERLETVVTRHEEHLLEGDKR